jgi:hypothetical protein
VISEGRRVGLLALALAAIVVIAASSAPGLSGAQSGSMLNCPPPGKWSIAVWDGAGGTTADDALASCGVDAVAAAYSLDAQTGAWSRWFAGKPDVSNLPPLGETQGLLALGGTAATAGGDTLSAAQAKAICRTARRPASGR